MTAIEETPSATRFRVLREVPGWSIISKNDDGLVAIMAYDEEAGEFYVASAVREGAGSVNVIRMVTVPAGHELSTPELCALV